MKLLQLSLKGILTSLILSMGFFGCSDDDDDPTPTVSNYFVGIETATDPTVDVLAFANELNTGKISPINNGFEQPASWTVFFQGKDQIFASAYTSAPEIVSYQLEDGALKKGDSFFTDLGIYGIDVVDEATMVLMGSARSGLSAKKIYLVNTNTMSITKTVTVDFGNIKEENLLAFPVDMKVRGDKLFVAYYHTDSEKGDFSTPKANKAYTAVFSYPGLEFDKIISDDRAPNLGRYFSMNVLEQDEKGDIYTYASSSLASGFFPTPPSKNSAVLRIKNGETEFDDSYYIDFETLSGGYKINDLFYVKDGKAVVRVLKEDESNIAYKWGAYSPNSENPLLETGILDLYNKKFTLLTNVPKGGGGWNSSVMVEDSKLYIGVSAKDFASIYVIDTKNGTATKGADIDGNYAKAILALYE